LKAQWLPWSAKAGVSCANDMMFAADCLSVTAALLRQQKQNQEVYNFWCGKHDSA